MKVRGAACSSPLGQTRTRGLHNQVCVAVQVISGSL